MNFSMDLINGLSLGIEYISADEEEGIDCNCILVDLLVFRLLFEFE